MHLIHAFWEYAERQANNGHIFGGQEFAKTDIVSDKRGYNSRDTSGFGRARFGGQICNIIWRQTYNPLT